MIELIVRYRWTALWVSWIAYCWAVFQLAGLR